jgi:hypothetical protein
MYVFYIYMENPQQQHNSRPLRPEDLFGKETTNKCDKHSHNPINNIMKNQEEFGNRKRIKP